MNEFCSADLLGYKFNVPCQVKEVLTIQYGEEKLWSMPTKTNYKTSNIDWQNGVKRTDEEILYMIRYYLHNGSIDNDLTIYNINKYLKKPISKLPTNDDEFI